MKQHHPPVLSICISLLLFISFVFLRWCWYLIDRQTRETWCPTVPGKLVYIGTCLGVVVFALIVVVLIFFRHHRNSRGSTSCGMTLKWHSPEKQNKNFDTFQLTAAAWLERLREFNQKWLNKNSVQITSFFMFDSHYVTPDFLEYNICDFQQQISIVKNAVAANFPWSLNRSDFNSEILLIHLANSQEKAQWLANLHGYHKRSSSFPDLRRQALPDSFSCVEKSRCGWFDSTKKLCWRLFFGCEQCGSTSTSAHCKNHWHIQPLSHRQDLLR